MLDPEGPDLSTLTPAQRDVFEHYKRRIVAFEDERTDLLTRVEGNLIVT